MARIVATVALDNLEKSAQTRAAIDSERVADLAEHIKEGKKLDPAKVIRCDDRLILSDGYHREEAYRLVGHKEMPCEITSGNEFDAIEAGIKANIEHRGKPPTRADVRNMIEMILTRWPETADNSIANLVGCDHKTVTNRRKEMVATGKIPVVEEKIGADGRK